MRLTLAAFVTGFSTLGLEITALRLLAPSFGSNLLVFANVIGVVLAGLAAGAALGGRWADRGADRRRAGGLMLGAGILIVLLPTFSAPFLRAARGALAAGSTSLFFWSLAAVTLFLLPPTFLLGAVAPFLVRLRVRRVEDVGRVSGSLSATATAGSLLGTFVPTLLTIPFLGTAATLRLLGGVLILASVLLLGRGSILALAVPFSLALVGEGAAPVAGVLEERESPYQHLRVEERSDGTRLLIADEGTAVQSSWRPGDRLSGTRVRRLRPARRRARRRHSLASRPRPRGRDHRPGLPVAAPGRRDHGRGDRRRRPRARRGATSRSTGRTSPPFPRTRGRSSCGRRRRFDAVAVDVFRGPHVPFHCATREFFALVKETARAGWRAHDERQETSRIATAP